MAERDWRAKKRNKELARVQRQLDELKEKGLGFEGNPPKKQSLVSHRQPSSLPWVLVGVLAVVVIVLFIVYGSKVSDLNSENEFLETALASKTDEVSNLSGKVVDLSEEVTAKGESASELNSEYDDLKTLYDKLKENLENADIEIADAKTTIADLTVNVTVKENLAEDYKDCITDDDGPIVEPISVCDDYL